MKSEAIKRTVSISADVSAQADIRADEEHRSFSNYVAWLIKEDSARVEREAKEREVSA